MIASLAMYDRPETAAANDRFWAEIRDRLCAHGIDAPSRLERAAPFWEVWQSPALLFSQTCGFPFRATLHETVALIGTPDYGLAGCPPGYYRSPFIVRARDPRTTLAEFRDTIFAYNEKLSQSGWAAPQCHAAAAGFQFENTICAGGHARSAAAVAEGRADIAALDALSWDMIKRYEEFSLDLRVLEWTAPTPGLPYITAANAPVGLIRGAVVQAIAALDLADRRVLRLKSLVEIPVPDYLAVPDP